MCDSETLASKLFDPAGLLTFVLLCSGVQQKQLLAAEPREPSRTRLLPMPIVPYLAVDFEAMRVTDAWEKYADRLTWGRGQCLAILDDGCDLNQPQWQAKLPWGPKVLVTYDAVDGDNDPAHVKPGYHGTTVGYPSSLFFKNMRGVAYNDYVAHVRSVSVVHLTKDETATHCRGHELGDRESREVQHHDREPGGARRSAAPRAVGHVDRQAAGRVAKAGYLGQRPLRKPSLYGRNFLAGLPGERFRHGGDRAGKTYRAPRSVQKYRAAGVCHGDVSSNAYAAGAAMMLREAIEKGKYDWSQHGENSTRGDADNFSANRAEN